MASVNGISPATRIALERMDASIAADIAGRPIYPADTVFLGADVEGAGEAVLDCARGGSALVIVYPDGAERVLMPTVAAGGGRLARLRRRLTRRR